MTTRVVCRIVGAEELTMSSQVDLDDIRDFVIAAPAGKLSD
jgi:hypothetical protein